MRSVAASSAGPLPLLSVGVAIASQSRSRPQLATGAGFKIRRRWQLRRITTYSAQAAK
jgi:hypothetical protein